MRFRIHIVIINISTILLGSSRIASLRSFCWYGLYFSGFNSFWGHLLRSLFLFINLCYEKLLMITKTLLFQLLQQAVISILECFGGKCTLAVQIGV